MIDITLPITFSAHSKELHFVNDTSTDHIKGEFIKPELCSLQLVCICPKKHRQIIT